MGNWLNFSIGTGLVPHWLNYFRVLHYYRLLSCRAKATWDKQDILSKTFCLCSPFRILRKNWSPFALFPFINSTSQMMKWRFLYIPFILFYYNLAFCPPNPLLIKMQNLHQEKIKSVFWKRLMERVKHLSCSLLQKS